MPEPAALPRRGGKRAVLLLAHGTPGSPEEIPEYLHNITSGRPIPAAVVDEIRHRYSLIGPSPLTGLTIEQARLLEETLGLPIYVGMRNWKPYIGDAVGKMLADGITAAVAICLAPQNSRTSVGLYRRAAFAEAGGRMTLEFVDNWAAHPMLAQAFAQRLLPAWQRASANAGRAVPVLFTAHSVPCRTIHSQPGSNRSATSDSLPPDSYPADAKRTAANVAALLAPAGLAPSGWFFAFQSQGMSGGPWIGPTVEDTLTALAAEGHRFVVLQPVGFLCDHVEILYDIDIAFRQFAAKLGLDLTRAPSLNDSPLLIETLADVARQGLARFPAPAEALFCPIRLMPGSQNPDESFSVSKSATEPIAIVGGGVAGLAAAYELARQGAAFILFEASARLGGIVETVRTQGFLIECGPDSWVTEKPWAAELASELGLRDQIVLSNDEWRATYIEKDQRLVALPRGMRMMVPTRWEAIEQSPLFSAEARRAYRAEPERAGELKASAPQKDESIACFVRRHFGEEVAESVAAPLLSGVFGGDIERLSVRAIMPGFVKMEADHGSLVAALQQKGAQGSPQPIFSTLAGGMATLVDRIALRLPADSVRLRQAVTGIEMRADRWLIATDRGEERFQSVLLGTPPETTRALLGSLKPANSAASGPAARIAGLLPQHSSSAIVVALGFAAERAARMSIPRGFGLLAAAATPGSGGDHRSNNRRLLACTFVDQKFPGRAPHGAVLLRAFFGGEAGTALQEEPDEALIRRTCEELASLLGPMPEHSVAMVRRLPRSLPQYEVGHLDRIAELESLASALPRLRLTGNAYRGVGVSDLIREGRAAARAILISPERGAG